MKRSFAVIVALLLFVVGMASTPGPDTEFENAYVSYNAKYSNRMHRLDSLRMLRTTIDAPVEQFAYTHRLARGYIDRNIDSALMFYDLGISEALSAGNDHDASLLKLERLSVMPLAGAETPAIYEFEQMDIPQTDSVLTKYYFLAAANLFRRIKKHYPRNLDGNFFREKIVENLDSLLAYLPYNSLDAIYYRGISHYYHGQLNVAAATLSDIIPELEHDPPRYLEANRIVAEYYKSVPNNRGRAKNYYRQALLNGLNHGYIPPDILAEYGKILSDNGQKSLGSKYIKKALEMDVQSNFPFKQVGNTHYISFEQERECKWLIIAVVVLSILLIATLVLYIVKYRQKKNADIAAEKAAAVYMAKIAREQQAGSILISLLANSMEQEAEMNVYVERKLTAGQSKDLFEKIKSGRYLQEQRSKFFGLFDEAFLSVYPDFVSKLNSFLLPDKRFEEDNIEILTPELRIAALIKLGQLDSEKISKMLGLSINTIYTYRNRLRSRAQDRTQIELKIKEI